MLGANMSKGIKSRQKLLVYLSPGPLHGQNLLSPRVAGSLALLAGRVAAESYRPHNPDKRDNGKDEVDGKQPLGVRAVYALNGSG